MIPVPSLVILVSAILVVMVCTNRETHSLHTESQTDTAKRRTPTTVVGVNNNVRIAIPQ